MWSLWFELPIEWFGLSWPCAAALSKVLIFDNLMPEDCNWPQIKFLFFSHAPAVILTKISLNSLLFVRSFSALYLGAPFLPESLFCIFSKNITMSVHLQHLETVGSSVPLEVVVSMGAGVMASVCWYLSASLRADTADICHLSISNLTALITIVPPPASPSSAAFPPLHCNQTHASHKMHSLFCTLV